MSAFSPRDAAFEGVRVVRREPKAVLYWVAVWAAALAAIGVIQFLSGPLTGTARPTGDFSFIRRFGPLAALIMLPLLTLWVMTTATVYRAVLRPGEHGWHLFKLGPDEARIALLSAALFVLAALLSTVPDYLLLVLLSPVFEAAPALNRLTMLGGVTLTMAIDTWIVVRLSLVAVQTFAEHSFPLRAYWEFARGRFWRLLASYVLVTLEFFLFLVASVVVGLIFGWLFETANHSHGAGLLRRAALWALVPVTALLGASALVAPVILLCGCQAYIYRAIAAETRNAPAAVAEPA